MGTDLYVAWAAYVLGTWPLENGDELARPRWDWYLQALARVPAIPDVIPPLAFIANRHGRVGRSK